MLDAQQRQNEAMAPCLLEHALARIDQHQSKVGIGRARRHVAGILLMAGRVGDDKLALVGREKPIGHVDGDALLAFGGQPIHQQRKVDPLVARDAVAAFLPKARELIVQHQLAVIKQPADQGGFAIVDASAGHEPQQRLIRLLRQPKVEIGVRSRHGKAHQKYPSCFFFSIDPTLSLSISRPSRSDVRLACISMMISGSVAASERIAPVNG